MLCAAVLLAGCGGGEVAVRSSTSTTTTTTVSAAAEIGAWRDEMQPVIDDLQASLKWISGAASSLDLSETRAACRDMREVLGRVENGLPSPDALVTKHLQSAIDTWRKMTSNCQALSPSTTQAEFDEVSDGITEGSDEFSAAIKRMNKIRDSE